MQPAVRHPIPHNRCSCWPCRVRVTDDLAQCLHSVDLALLHALDEDLVVFTRPRAAAAMRVPISSGVMGGRILDCLQPLVDAGEAGVRRAASRCAKSVSRC